MTPDYGWEFVRARGHRRGRLPGRRDARATPPVSGRARSARSAPSTWSAATGRAVEVREAIGRELAGDQANHAWGVMDVLAVTDFPDIRTKCAIQSGSGGNILLIPREGGHLFRMYVDLGEVATGQAGHGPRDHDRADHRARQRDPASVHARREERRLAQRLRGRAPAHRRASTTCRPTQLGTRTPRVFIAGDACHTHSAKAGQGMNVSMQDGFNLGWKLGHVLDGRAPESLLATYSAERQVVAQDLIDFDREWSTLMAKRPEEFADSDRARGLLRAHRRVPGRIHDAVRAVDARRRRHAPGARRRVPDRQALQRRRRSTRVCDGNPVHLGHHARRRRSLAALRVRRRARPRRATSASPRSPTGWPPHPTPPSRHTPAGADVDAWFDVKVIYQQDHTDVDITTVPDGVPSARRPVRARSTSRRSTRPTRRRHLRAARASTATVSSSSSGPTSTSRTCCPLSATDGLAAFFRPLLTAAAGAR